MKFENSRKIAIPVLSISILVTIGYVFAQVSFSPPNIYQEDLPVSASYVIKTDGLWYWAVKHDGSIDFESFNPTETVQNAIDDIASDGLVYLMGFNLPEEVTLRKDVIVMTIHSGTIELYGEYYDYANATIEQIAIRLNAAAGEHSSKPIIEWVDYEGKPVAWIVAHYMSNDNMTVHKHISIETNKGLQDGDLYTRFSVGYGKEKVQISFRLCDLVFLDDASPTFTITDSTTPVSGYLKADDDRFYIYTLTNSDFRLGTNSITTRLVITGAKGYVGINTAAPNSQFQVNGSLALTSRYVNWSPFTVGGVDYYIRADCRYGNMIINLPDAAGKVGRIYIFKKIDSSPNSVTISAFNSQTIDGSFTKVLSSRWDYVQIICTGTNWEIIGGNP